MNDKCDEGASQMRALLQAAGRAGPGRESFACVLGDVGCLTSLTFYCVLS